MEKPHWVDTLRETQNLYVDSRSHTDNPKVYYETFCWHDNCDVVVCTWEGKPKVIQCRACGAVKDLEWLSNQG